MIAPATAACWHLPPAVESYLASQGITDPATWAAYRLNEVDEITRARFLAPTQQRHLQPKGVWIPTSDPRQPAVTVGLIRLTPAQNKFAVVGDPTGIAAPVDLDQRRRVVLVDNPLLALRLHQSGVADTAMVASPQAVAAIQPWCANREVALLSTSAPGLARMRAALGEHPAPALGALVMGGQLSAEVSTWLGVERPPPEPAPVLTPMALNDLVEFARHRLGDGAGLARLAAFGVSTADLIQSYRIGYLPADYRLSIPSTTRAMLQGHSLGNSLIIPAFDEQRVVVDLHIISGDPVGPATEGLWDTPRGLLAPELVRDCRSLMVVDRFSWLVRRFAEGHRDVLLLRGPQDTVANAARLAANGVTTVQVQAYRRRNAIIAALRSAGMQIAGVPLADPPSDLTPDPLPDSVATAPAPDDPTDLDDAGDPGYPSEVVGSTQPHPGADTPVSSPAGPPPTALGAPSPLTSGEAGSAFPIPRPLLHLQMPVDLELEALRFVEEEYDGQVAIFQAGALRYAVTLREDGLTLRRVVVRVGGRTFQDEVDLAVAAQRERTARNAALRLAVPVERIQPHLSALLTGVQEHERARDVAPSRTVSPEDRVIAETYLTATNLPERILSDLTALGWVGEDTTKLLLYLASISRLLPDPVWAVYEAGSGAAPWRGLACIAALTPPEDVVVFHHITDAALFQAERAGMRHRLLMVDRAETLRPEAAISLRILGERGSIGLDASVPYVCGAPVAVLAAAAGPIDLRCRECFLRVTADESPEQTASIQADLCRRKLAAQREDRVSAQGPVIAAHHALHRLLERVPVSIPFAERVSFPSNRMRHRHEHAWFLGLVSASALLHQRQRQRQDGALIATEADFQIAARASQGLLGGVAGGLGHRALQLLGTVAKHGRVEFTMADLSAIVPDWNRYTCRAAIQDLLDFGHLTSSQTGRGRLRHYQVKPTVGNHTGTILLRPAEQSIPEEQNVPEEISDLALVGEIASPTVTRDGSAA